MRALAILNPRAGVAARRARQALEAARPAWPGLEVRVTTGPGDTRAWSAEAAAAGLDTVLAVGGDGTANEAAWGLLGSETALGLVPVGSGNGLARTLRIPLRPGRALAALADAVSRRMDVGLLNDRPFLNVAGAGLDAAVGADFHLHGRAGGRRGVLTYVRLTLRRVRSYEPGTFSVRADGERFDGRALLVCFVNGRQYGGAAVIAPGARLDDGLMDVVVFEAVPFREILANAPRLFLGGLERFRAYRRFPAREAEVVSPSAVPVHRDGEPEPPVERLSVRLAPRALRILVPRATADDPAGPFA